MEFDDPNQSYFGYDNKSSSVQGKAFANLIKLETQKSNSRHNNNNNEYNNLKLFRGI